jgi:hypothetical protein
LVGIKKNITKQWINKGILDNTKHKKVHKIMEKHKNLRQHKAPESTQNNGKHRNLRQYKTRESAQNNGEAPES